MTRGKNSFIHQLEGEPVVSRLLPVFEPNKPNKQVLVLGLGASGDAAARLARAHGAAVTVADAAATPALLARAAELRTLGCSVELGAAMPPPGNFDLCIVSPGLCMNGQWLRAVCARGIPVVPEFEYGLRDLHARVLAVTGSNGKSTFVKLCAETLICAGMRTCIAGNYGTPVCRVALDAGDWDWVALEVSSFQLESAREFRPDVGVLLNILPNHLDRHGDIDAYRKLKFKMFDNMRAGDTRIIERTLPPLMPANAAAVRTVTFGAEPPADFFYRAGKIIAPDGLTALDVSGTAFDNPTLGAAAAAAAAAMDACGVEKKRLSETIRRFECLPHRLEDVAMARGVRFVNDSKATNVAALCAALRALPEPIRLIAGGQGKGESFIPAAPLLREKAAAIYLIGRDASCMMAAWKDVAPCRECGTLAAACDAAWRDARDGDVILLSPACASYDQFRNFEERGNCFRDWACKFASVHGSQFTV